MVQYEWFGPDGQRRSSAYDEREASSSIGNRVTIGFPVSQRHFESPSGESVWVVFFQSDVTGDVWAVYFE